MKVFLTAIQKQVNELKTHSPFAFYRFAAFQSVELTKANSRAQRTGRPCW